MELKEERILDLNSLCCLNQDSKLMIMSSSKFATITCCCQCCVKSSDCQKISLNAHLNCKKLLLSHNFF